MTRCLVAVAVFGAAIFLASCGGATSIPGGNESTVLPESSKPAVGISDEKVLELLSMIDCADGVDPGNLAWRDQLTRYSGQPLAAVAWCVGDSGAPVELMRYTGDLAVVGALLAREDDTSPLQEGQGCDDYYDPQPNLWLVTTGGEVLQPRWPLDVCDHLLPPVPDEIFTADVLDPVRGSS